MSSNHNRKKGISKKIFLVPLNDTSDAAPDEKLTKAQLWERWKLDIRNNILTPYEILENETNIMSATDNLHATKTKKQLEVEASNANYPPELHATYYPTKEEQAAAELGIEADEAPPKPATKEEQALALLDDAPRTPSKPIVEPICPPAPKRGRTGADIDRQLREEEEREVRKQPRIGMPPRFSGTYCLGC